MAVSPDNTDVEAESKRELNRVFLETERDSHAKLDQVMMGLGDAVNLLAGFRGKSGIEVAMEIIHLDEEKQKEALEDALFVILVDQLQQNITALKQQIADNNLRISELEAHAEVISGLIERLEDGERFALNVDGSLKDAEAEAIIAAYEDKYGVTVDRNDPEQLRSVLEDIETRVADLRKETEVLEGEIEKRERIIQDLEKPETRIAALEKISELADVSSESDMRVTDDLVANSSAEVALTIIRMRTDHNSGALAIAESSLAGDAWGDSELVDTSGTLQANASPIKPDFEIAASVDEKPADTKPDVSIKPNELTIDMDFNQ